MKVCDNCSRINPDDAEKCLECGGEEFETLHFRSDDAIEPYLEEKDDDRDRN